MKKLLLLSIMNVSCSIFAMKKEVNIHEKKDFLLKKITIIQNQIENNELISATEQKLVRNKRAGDVFNDDLENYKIIIAQETPNYDERERLHKNEIIKDTEKDIDENTKYRLELNQELAELKLVKLELVKEKRILDYTHKFNDENNKNKRKDIDKKDKNNNNKKNKK